MASALMEQYAQSEKKSYEFERIEVQNRMQAQAFENERRRAQLTLVEIKDLTDDAKTFKPIGRLYVSFNNYPQCAHAYLFIVLCVSDCNLQIDLYKSLLQKFAMV